MPGPLVFFCGELGFHGRSVTKRFRSPESDSRRSFQVCSYFSTSYSGLKFSKVASLSFPVEVLEAFMFTPLRRDRPIGSRDAVYGSPIVM